MNGPTHHIISQDIDNEGDSAAYNQTQVITNDFLNDDNEVQYLPGRNNSLRKHFFSRLRDLSLSMTPHIT